MRRRYDVAIVGYGPVGRTLAILVAERGWTVGVFERQPAPYPLHVFGTAADAGGAGALVERLRGILTRGTGSR